jgi:ABC-type phosphate/phosphonate transport system permease subunit
MLPIDTNIKSGVLGGAMLSTITNINYHDIEFTIVMAIIGTVVSFVVSYLLRILFSDKNK